MPVEYEVLLALKSYLDEEAAAMLEEMVANREPLDDINRFVNNALTIKQVNSTKMLSTDTDKMEFREYYNELTPEDQLWIKKFYYERYANAIYNIPKDYLLHNTEELIKESNRIRNNAKGDMYDLAERLHLLDNFIEERLIPDDLDDTTDWETIFKYKGHKDALDFLIKECLEELKVKHFDPKLALVRFYIKMNRLRIVTNRDNRNPKRKSDEA